MSKHEAKKLAEQFIDDQARILEENGDKVIKSKRKKAVASVQQIFQALSSKSKNGNAVSQARS
jgi:vacuolar-type H+-ATPase subunit E/Vma4